MLACFLERFGDSLARNIQAWSAATDAEAHALATIDIVSTVMGATKAPPVGVCNFGVYTAKRVCELIFLAGSAEVAGTCGHMSDSNECISNWPLPSGSRTRLREVFSGTSSEKLLREGLRVIQRALVARKVRMDLACIVAALCFWKRESQGAVVWT